MSHGRSTPAPEATSTAISIHTASRIQNAGRDISFKALSDEVGYSDISVFYRAFKRETGCTPAIYRAQILKMDTNEDMEGNS